MLPSGLSVTITDPSYCLSKSAARFAASQITILVYDYAEVTAETRQEAEKVAVEILTPAGVETAWHDCSLAETLELPDSKQASNPTKLVLRILPRSKAARAGYRFRSSICGLTMQHEGVGRVTRVPFLPIAFKKPLETRAWPRV